MPNLQNIKHHIKAVTNIQKITTSMKMIAATMYIKAEKKLRRIHGLREGVRKFYQLNPASADDQGRCVVALTSDRGLCGGIHHRVCQEASLASFKLDPLVLVGNRSKEMLGKNVVTSQRVVLDAVGVGHRPPSFHLAGRLAQKIPATISPQGLLFHAEPQGMSSYKVRVSQLHTPPIHEPTLAFKYELEDLESFLEFSTACVFFCALCEGFTAELAARVAAMSSASKNASKMRKRLLIMFNQYRQQKITMDLIDIITGAEDMARKSSKKVDRSRLLREERTINITLYGVPKAPFTTCPFKVF